MVCFREAGSRRLKRNGIPFHCFRQGSGFHHVVAFIGSSSEGLEFARAIRAALANDAEVTLWNEGFFTVGTTFIERLVNSVSQFDFAILVLTPDDLVRSRSDELLGPRDNVIFELGLFMGGLGRERTFMVHQAEAQIKMPTDLSGVTTAQYFWPRADNNYQAAVGLACDAIRKAVHALGFSPEKASKRVLAVAKEQARQAGELGWIKMLVDLIVSEYERTHMRSLAADGPFLADVKRGSTFEWEIRHLLSLQLIDRHPGKGMRSLFGEQGKRDVKEHLYITERGREYLLMFDELSTGGGAAAPARY